MADNKAQSNIKFRPPVVVVLGHVDHGKTKLLSVIRNVAAPKEAGDITQHIGAYQTDVDGRSITFLDTPGHEAFTAVRSRGAKVADIAVLVVAADESVKPQTKEAIRIIKEEKIPVVVAINKIDKEGANVQKVKQDLATEDVLVEDWGGKVPVVEISAKQNRNIKELLDMILLVADLEELEAEAAGPAMGVMIESHLDKRRGYVATALVQSGVLSLGGWIVAGKVVSKVKAMEDFTGKSVVEAGPSQPVIVVGWSEAPDTGAPFTVSYSKSDAESIAEENKGVTLAPLFSFLKESPDSDKKIYGVILKADVRGSLEAIESALQAIKSDEVRCNVVGYEIGEITENDVKTAIATKSDVIGFRVGVGQSVVRLAEKEGVRVATFDVIYELIEAIRRNMANLLEPEVKRTLLGKLKVIALFSAKGGPASGGKKDAKNQVVGGKVVSGKMARGAAIDIIRGGNVIGKGRLGQLQHNKEDVSEVKEGLEAGIRFDLITGQPFQEIQVGDILEIYEEEKIARNL